MKRIAIYGKGGIGKSTVAVNTAILLSKRGLRVALIGCDPKQDTIRLITEGNIPSILERYEALNEGKRPITDCVVRGRYGILCAEVGGPRPGVGCAGRGIILALELLTKNDCFSDLDVIIFDVLGDVVCGGFATPVVRGYAEDIYIVSSGEQASLYAANNILRGMCDIGHGVQGLVLNAAGFTDETMVADAFSALANLPIVARIPHDARIPANELKGIPAVDVDELSEYTDAYGTFCSYILGEKTVHTCTPLDREAFYSSMCEMQNHKDGTK